MNRRREEFKYTDPKISHLPYFSYNNNFPQKRSSSSVNPLKVGLQTDEQNERQVARRTGGQY